MKYRCFISHKMGASQAYIHTIEENLKPVKISSNPDAMILVSKKQPTTQVSSKTASFTFVSQNSQNSRTSILSEKLNMDLDSSSNREATMTSYSVKGKCTKNDLGALKLSLQENLIDMCLDE